jgi:hypothetical protein
MSFYNFFLILTLLLLILWLFLVGIQPKFSENVYLFIAAPLSFMMALLPITVMIKGIYIATRVGKRLSFGRILLIFLLLIPCSFFSAIFIAIIRSSGVGFSAVGYIILLMEYSFFAYVILLPIVGVLARKYFAKKIKKNV